MGNIFPFSKKYLSRILSFLLARFASLQLDWATTTSRLLDPATCLPHKDEGILLKVPPKDTTTKLVLHNYPFCDERQAGKLPLQFFEVY